MHGYALKNTSSGTARLVLYVCTCTAVWDDEDGSEHYIQLVNHELQTEYKTIGATSGYAVQPLLLYWHRIRGISPYIRRCKHNFEVILSLALKIETSEGVLYANKPGAAHNLFERRIKTGKINTISQLSAIISFFIDLQTS